MEVNTALKPAKVLTVSVMLAQSEGPTLQLPFFSGAKTMTNKQQTVLSVTDP